jgi:hypothetical protein
MVAAVIIIFDSVRRWTRGRRSPATSGEAEAVSSAA